MEKTKMDEVYEFLQHAIENGTASDAKQATHAVRFVVEHRKAFERVFEEGLK